MSNRKSKLGSPFEFGSLASVLLSALLTVLFLYWEFSDGETQWMVRGLVLVGAAMTFKGYLRYRKIQVQGGINMIGDDQI